jgi:hypothetical protein
MTTFWNSETGKSSRCGRERRKKIEEIKSKFGKTEIDGEAWLAHDTHTHIYVHLLATFEKKKEITTTTCS